MKKLIPQFILYIFIIPIEVIVFLLNLFVSIPFILLGGNYRFYALNVLKTYDRLGNAKFFGSDEETISSRLGRNYRGSFLERFVDKIFIFMGFPDGNHCEDVIEPLDHENDAIFK